MCIADVSEVGVVSGHLRGVREEENISRRMSASSGSFHGSEPFPIPVCHILCQEAVRTNTSAQSLGFRELLVIFAP